jgi:hypothetical protein
MSDYANKIEQAAVTLADAVVHEMELEDTRHVVKLNAIEYIMGSGDNKLTGKPHSFSSAEALVHTDDGYAAHLAKLRHAARDRILAKGRYDAAVIAATLQENINV